MNQQYCGDWTSPLWHLWPSWLQDGLLFHRASLCRGGLTCHFQNHYLLKGSWLKGTCSLGPRLWGKVLMQLLQVHRFLTVIRPKSSFFLLFPDDVLSGKCWMFFITRTCQVPTSLIPPLINLRTLLIWLSFLCYRRKENLQWNLMVNVTWGKYAAARFGTTWCSNGGGLIMTRWMTGATMSAPWWQESANQQVLYAWKLNAVADADVEPCKELIWCRSGAPEFITECQR